MYGKGKRLLTWLQQLNLDDSQASEQASESQKTRLIPPRYRFKFRRRRKRKRNQNMRSNNRKDPAWKYGKEVIGSETEKKSYKYIQCVFCNKTVTGGVMRMKDHLACTHRNVAPCPNVPQEVKKEISDYLLTGNMKKQLQEQNFEDMVESGSYFGKVGAFDDFDPSHGERVHARGMRGPMDRFMRNNDDNEEANNLVPNPNATALTAKELRNQTCLDIGRFFFENAIPFHAAKSPSFINMIRSVGSYGRGLKPPTMYELRTWILRQEVSTTESIVAEIKKTWVKTGVSILSDGWSDMKNRSLINFLVNNPNGTVFLKSIDASDAVKDAELMFKLLDDVVEEVGEHIVVQVVTDNASAYKAAGRKLMEKRKHLYWTPCAAHCIDLMLEKLGELPQHKNALLKSKKVSNYIYNHAWVLALMRKFTNLEVIRPGPTRFATAYLTLQRILQLKQPLESMFTSEKWVKSSYANKSDGKEIRKIVVKDKYFWPSVCYALKCTKPLFSVLRLVDSEQMPAMGFIYGAMDSAKEEIAKNLGGDEASYKEIWSIIDDKWDFQLHQHLHAAAYFLNPHFQYDENFSCHSEVTLGLYSCMERLIPDRNQRNEADLQIDEFRNKKGFFGLEQAKTSCKKRSPVHWWTQFGDGTPALKKFAIRVLSLTCSSSACERNWSSFNQVHTKRRNRLTTQRMNSLVYVMYNKKLKDRRLRLQQLKEDEDPLTMVDLPSDDEWIIDGSGEDQSNTLNMEDNDLDIDIFGAQGNEGATTSRNQRKRKLSDLEKAKSKGKVIQLQDEEDEWENVESDEEDDIEARDFMQNLSDSE